MEQSNMLHSLSILLFGAIIGFGLDAMKEMWKLRSKKKAVKLLVAEDLENLLSHMTSEHFPTEFWDNNKMVIAEVHPKLAVKYGSWITRSKNSLTKTKNEWDYRPGIKDKEEYSFYREGFTEGNSLLKELRP